MIQVQTVLTAADNSGAKKIQCIKVLGGSKRRYARIGDIIKISVQSTKMCLNMCLRRMVRIISLDMYPLI